MSPNPNKIKGDTWERDFVKILEENLEGTFKKIPGSGALGTRLHENRLSGDVVGKIDGFPKEIRVECKVGYGGKSQLTIQKAWLDKIGEEARSSFAIPLLAAKFSGARSGVKHIIIMDLDTFLEIMDGYVKKNG